MKKLSQKSKPFNLILLGDPASGKGTHAARLVSKYHLYNFDMGHEVRKPAIRKKFDFTKTTGIGKLTPTDIVRDILRRTIKSVPANQGILFNGHPKMIGEARLVAKLLRESGRTDPIVIYLTIPAAESLQRVRNRVVVIGGRSVRRDDDTEQALINRRKYYQKQISQVAVFFKKKYAFEKVSTLGTKDQAARRIVAAIERERQRDDD
jgi:adenylate kinase